MRCPEEIGLVLKAGGHAPDAGQATAPVTKTPDMQPQFLEIADDWGSGRVVKEVQVGARADADSGVVLKDAAAA